MRFEIKDLIFEIGELEILRFKILDDFRFETRDFRVETRELRFQIWDSKF